MVSGVLTCTGTRMRPRSRHLDPRLSLGPRAFPANATSELSSASPIELVTSDFDPRYAFFLELQFSDQQTHEKRL